MKECECVGVVEKAVDGGVEHVNDVECQPVAAELEVADGVEGDGEGSV